MSADTPVISCRNAWKIFGANPEAYLKSMKGDESFEDIGTRLARFFNDGNVMFALFIRPDFRLGNIRKASAAHKARQSLFR